VQSLSQSATVSIDGGAPYDIVYGGAPPTYMQWYQTPLLPDGKHTITVGHLASTSVDYAIIKVGPNTSLSGTTVIVDNESPVIVYAGKWSRSTAQFNAGSLPGGFPYGNSTHRSSSVGDSITFRFTGEHPAITHNPDIDIYNLEISRHICFSIWNLFMGEPRCFICNIHSRRRYPFPVIQCYNLHTELRE